MASGDPLMSRELFGLDLLEGAPHGQTSGLDMASREKLLDNLQRHHRIRPLGNIRRRLLRLVRVLLRLAKKVSRTAFESRCSLTMASSGGSFARPVMRS
jgi:hypothetical protein